eukprot:TRINITY_DN29810_c0_g1_i1.p1 TRINITY_DN29810_c0_g1~~TRINITY_DN29810_c0_g1_i1.p1  ORF type:complete len:289 (+),score=46.42 TRINITY_DN29810_c0_g1_i1:108-869(+)
MASICLAAAVPDPACGARPGRSLLQLSGDERQQVQTSLHQGHQKGRHKGHHAADHKGHDAAGSVPAPGPAPPAKLEVTLMTSNSSGNTSGNASGSETGNGSESSIASIRSKVTFTHSAVKEVIVDLSANAARGINLSRQMAPGPPPPLPEQAPYSSKNTTQEIVMQPIKSAKPLPALTGDNITGHLRDCIMGDWSEWSSCTSSPLVGRKGYVQHRLRKVIQPWLEGGKLCGTATEAQNCMPIAVAKELAKPTL